MPLEGGMMRGAVSSAGAGQLGEEQM